MRNSNYLQLIKIGFYTEFQMFLRIVFVITPILHNNSENQLAIKKSGKKSHLKPNEIRTAMNTWKTE